MATPNHAAEPEATMQFFARHSRLATSKLRSAKWPECEKAFLAANPACRGCGSRHDLNIHHIRPFHLSPGLELDPANLVTACRRCHFVLCHLNDWTLYDPDCLAVLDAHHAKREKAHGRADRPPDDPGSRLAGAPDEHRPHDGH